MSCQAISSNFPCFFLREEAHPNCGTGTPSCFLFRHKNPQFFSLLFFFFQSITICLGIQSYLSKFVFDPHESSFCCVCRPLFSILWLPLTTTTTTNPRYYFWLFSLWNSSILVFYLFVKFFAYFKDYYKVLEIEYDATDEDIRLNYRRLALVGNLSFFSGHPFHEVENYTSFTY